MKLYAMLPPNREAEGVIWGVEDGRVVFGPERSRGEADNTGAFKAGNVQEDPTRAFGDHPYGTYRITDVVRDPAPARSYGPAFLKLAPVSGQAWEARQNGRTGLGIHGGDPGPNDTLRPTFGCLRVTNEVAERLAGLVERQLAAIGECWYECVEQGTAAHVRPPAEASA